MMEQITGRTGRQGVSPKPIYQFDKDGQQIQCFQRGITELITKLQLNMTPDGLRVYILKAKLLNDCWYFSYDPVFIPKPPKAY